MALLSFKQLELGDFTNRGSSKAGCALVVIVGVSCACAVGTMTADALKHPTDISRRIVGFTVGGSVAACATGGLSSRNPELSLIGLILGALLSSYCATTLRSLPPDAKIHTPPRQSVNLSQKETKDQHL